MPRPGMHMFVPNPLPSHHHDTRIEVIDEETGKVRLGLICGDPRCRRLIDSLWVPAALQCLAAGRFRANTS